MKSMKFSWLKFDCTYDFIKIWYETYIILKNKYKDYVTKNVKNEEDEGIEYNMWK